MPVTQLVRVVITVADLPKAASFMRDALGLDTGPERPLSDPAWMALLGLQPGTAGRVATVKIGHGEAGHGESAHQAIKLVAFDPPGASRGASRGVPYPTPRSSNDQWFQHVALVAGDMEAVWKRLEAVKPEPITDGAPVLLPPNTGSVTAFKFRDHEGHPFELISFPNGVGDPRWQDGGPGIRGYDHTAIAVTDLERSVAFYTELLGFHVGGKSLNEGPEQDRLDGLKGTLVDVVALQPTLAPTPHVELLHYRTPPGRVSASPLPANDVASVRQVHKVDDLEGLVTRLERGGAYFVSPGPVTLETGDKAVSLRDPDGHMIVLLG